MNQNTSKVIPIYDDSICMETINIFRLVAIGSISLVFLGLLYKVLFIERK